MEVVLAPKPRETSALNLRPATEVFCCPLPDCAANAAPAAAAALFLNIFLRETGDAMWAAYTRRGLRARCTLSHDANHGNLRFSGTGGSGNLLPDRLARVRPRSNRPALLPAHANQHQEC